MNDEILQDYWETGLEDPHLSLRGSTTTKHQSITASVPVLSY